MEDQERIIKVDIESEMRKSYIDYSMSVIVARALPDVRDGFKPVHRTQGFGILAVNDFILVRYHDLTMKGPNEEEMPVVKIDTVETPVSDTVRVRSNPYDIRGDKAERRTIDIVKDKPIHPLPRRR